MWGTSHAAPQVSAAVALVANSGMPAIRALHRVLSAARPLPLVRDPMTNRAISQQLGAGVLDIEAAFTNDAVRLAGPDRYQTSAEVSREIFPGDPDHDHRAPGHSSLLPRSVVLVRGSGLSADDGFADALAAAPLAGEWFADAPVLLTPPATPQYLDAFQRGDSPIRAEIDRALGCPKAERATRQDGVDVRIWVVGGQAAVDPGYLDALEECFATSEIRRVAGPDRYWTAREVARQVVPLPPAGSFNVFLATGTDYPDALAAAPRAYGTGSPIILTPRDLQADGNLHPAVDDFFATHHSQIGRVYVLGGTNAISSDVVSKIRTRHDVSIERIAGTTRYHTARKVAERFYPTPNQAIIATGSNWPDAVTAGGLGAFHSFGLPLLLTSSKTTNLHPEADTWLATTTSLDTVYVPGGPAAVKHPAFRRTDDLVN